MLRTLAKLLFAGALLAGICLAAQHFIFAPGGSTLWRQAFGIVVTIAVGAAAFFGAAYLLHVAEVRDVVQLVRGRFAKAHVT
jgi:hypothetical protein